MDIFLQNTNELLAHPASLFALLGVLLLITLFLRLRHIRMTTTMLVYIGLMLAVTILLHQLKLYKFLLFRQG